MQETSRSEGIPAGSSTQSNQSRAALQRADRLKLVTRGRKTGLPHVVELRYARVNGSFFVAAGRGRSDWFLNALHSRVVTLHAGEFLIEASPRIATQAERSAVAEIYRKRYGRRFVEDWYGEFEACVCLTPTGAPVRRGGATGELDTSTTFADWSKSHKEYYADVAAAFDSASDEYDFTISRNFINTWIRRRSIGVLEEYLNPSDLLLEVGCGTGAEALEISKRVKGIVAVDISEKMVELLRAKVKARNLEDRVFPLRLAASEISRVRDVVGDRKLRVAYSFNGALNCEPRVVDFARQLHSLLEPQGIFVCSVRNTLCLTEIVSHAAVMQFDRMAPRKKQPTMVSVGGMEIPSRYFTPGRFLDFFRPYFEAEKIIALPGLLPPAYLNEYYLKLRNFTSILERAESLLSTRYPINRLGDQTLFVLKRA